MEDLKNKIKELNIAIFTLNSNDVTPRKFAVETLEKEIAELEMRCDLYNQGFKDGNNSFSSYVKQ